MMIFLTIYGEIRCTKFCTETAHVKIFCADILINYYRTYPAILQNTPKNINDYFYVCFCAEEYACYIVKMLKMLKTFVTLTCVLYTKRRADFYEIYLF